MLTHSDSVHIRYVALLNGLAALAPASILKGRANDPLLHTSWWTVDQHSAVIVVSVATVLGTILVFLLLKHNFRRWWMFLLSGSLTGMFPGLFYMVAAPLNDQLFVMTTAMIIAGLIWGGLMGVAIYAVVRKPEQAPNPNNRWSGPDA